MTYKTFTCNQDVVAVDIHTMGDMSLEDYNEYIRTGLLTVDHHDILRSEPAGYPLAVTKAQFNALLAYLKEIGPRVGA
ncbi:hypothetical protein [Methylovulum sp.]|uniref:hypothetical protein n=1 Tax=Methylovulum sp. TaxID=1916980 RepID=UPI00260A9A30|nr:hypothetical protein [Methylovulum sp.]MDD5125033.1 hypothetical protein [Methylovulum sp.]